MHIFVTLPQKGSPTKMQFNTPVTVSPSPRMIFPGEKILLIGSCFSDSVGERMKRSGLDVLVNPFGTLYNPVSVSNSLFRLNSGVPFKAEDCVRMGAGSDLVCSFSHHTSFARNTEEEFLEGANAALGEASAFFKECTCVIVTLGTSWCYFRGGEVVSNCLKRPADEFARKMLPSDATASILEGLVKSLSDGGKRRFIFNVSPVRHMADTAHGNQISKSSLLLAEEQTVRRFPMEAEYFPSYEIMMDELRDYRFYDADMVHPSDVAVDYIWEKFREAYFTPEQIEDMKKAEKLWRRSQHRPMH